MAFIGSFDVCADQKKDEVCMKSIEVDSIVLSHVTQKIQLFMYERCSYCIKVSNFLKQHDLMDQVELIDVGITINRELLRSISGKTQAPYLVDFDANVKMPESLDIIAYFTKKFKVTMPVLASTSAFPIVKNSEVTQYDSSTFLSFVKNSQNPVVILISTTWCPPCKIFKPIFVEVAQQFADVCEFIYVDGDEDKLIVDQLGVQCYPSIVCYKNGKQINPENYRSKVDLLDFITQFVV